PSWSISAEFYTYLTFATLWITFPTQTVRVVLSLIVACFIALLILSPSNLDVSTQLGFVRCLYGFGCGALAYRILRWIRLPTNNMFIATALEVATAVATLAFVWAAGASSFSVLAPVVFSAAVLVFAFEAGAVSRLLRTPPFLLLGAWSYSIYMV